MSKPEPGLRPGWGRGGVRVHRASSGPWMHCLQPGLLCIFEIKALKSVTPCPDTLLKLWLKTESPDAWMGGSTYWAWELTGPLIKEGHITNHPSNSLKGTGQPQRLPQAHLVWCMPMPMPMGIYIVDLWLGAQGSVLSAYGG